MIDTILKLRVLPNFALFSCALLLYLTFFAIFYFGDLRGVESNVVFTVQLMLENNSSLYSNPERFPFTVTQYSPMYYVICDLVLSFLDVNAADSHRILILMRCISITFFFLTCLLLFRLIFLSFKVSGYFSFVLVSGFISLVFPWYFLARPDVLVAFFFVVSLYCILSHQEESNYLLVFLAGFAVSFGVASKLNMLMFVPVYGFLFVWFRDAAAGVVFFLGMLMAFLLIYVLMELAGYDLNWLPNNIFDGVNNRSSLENAVAKPYKAFLSNYFVFAVSSFLLLCYAWSELVAAGFRRQLITLVTLIAGVFMASSVAALKVGSAVHYYNEFLLLSVILIGFSMKCLKPTCSKLVLAMFSAFVIQISIIHSYRYTSVVLWQSSFSNAKILVSPNRQKVTSYLRDNLNGGYFYSVDRHISHALFGSSVLFASDIIFSSFRREIYDDDFLNNAVADGSIKYMVLKGKRVPWVFENFRESFELNREFGDYRIYSNNNRSPNPE